jgi:5-methylcytosine-specific restriction endonuclease McrA
MSWLRIDDKMIVSMKVLGLVDDGVTGERAKQQRMESVGSWTFLLTWASSESSDGFIPTVVTDLFIPQRAMKRLLRARFDRQPLMHTRADDGTAPECRCLEGRAWPADMRYALHDFLDRNPSRSEADVQRAKKRELRDSGLKRAVRDRDRDCCRYCGRHCSFTDRSSDAGLTFDHPDPLIADGMNNLVVACRACNNRKNKRRPEQVTPEPMVLLPPPGNRQELQPTYDETCDEAATKAATVAGPVTTPVTGPRATTSTDLPADLRQTDDSSQVLTSPGRDGAGTGTALGPPDTRRSVLHPSPYDPKTESHWAGHPPDPPGDPP